MTSGRIYSRLVLCVLGLVCAGALLIRLEGMYWPRLHPDEPVIGAWLDQSAQGLYSKDRVYPNGFFTLARPWVVLDRALCLLSRQFDYFSGRSDRMRNLSVDGIALGRWINVFAGALACVPIFLMVARMTRAPWAGLFAACLAGFAQYAVEHSHYAETDVSALLTLAVALWLFTVARDTGQVGWFAGAALAGGFAAGTKFTLLALAPLLIIEAVIVAWHRFPAVAWQKRGGWIVSGLLLFGAGFVIANPAVLLDGKWFWNGLGAEQRRVFAETALNLGPLGAQPFVKQLHHIMRLGNDALTLGYPWLALIAVGLPCLALRVYRRYWTLLILFPLTIAYYWVFMAPWVRSQEFLFFLPSLAAIAALPLVAIWRARRPLSRGCVIIIAAIAIAVNGCNGWRSAALFGWKDTRLMAAEWLHGRLPQTSSLAAEAYAEAACIETLVPPTCIRKIEHNGLELLQTKGVDYLLRASSITGRGNRHPLTGALYPEPANNLKAFMAGSELLCSWAPLPPQGWATFVSPQIDLYGLKRFIPDITLEIELPQPALIVNGDQNTVGRQTFGPLGHRLGCAITLLVDCFPQTIAVAGPMPLDQPVFLVLTTAERAAVIRVRGFGLSRKITLNPYDTAIVPLQRSGKTCSQPPFERIVLAADPVKDVLYIPCYARIVYSAAEAARLCLDTAREDRITKYLSPEQMEQALKPAEQYIIATRLGLWPLADKIEPRIAALRDKIGQGLEAGNKAVCLNGNSGYYYDQFARARLQQPFDSADGEPQQANLPPRLKVLDLELTQRNDTTRAGRQPAQLRPYCRSLPLPVLLARSKCELAGEVMIKTKEDIKVIALALAGHPSLRASGHELELCAGHWTNFSFTLNPGVETQPQLMFSSPAPAQVCLRNMEVRWNMASVLESVQSEMTMAMLRHSLHKANWQKAAGQLAALDSKTRNANEIEVLQMQFKCADALNDASLRRATSARLLAIAPGHFLALAAMAAEDALVAGIARPLQGNLGQTLIFAPWIKLVGFSFDPGKREACCVFESLRNDTPGLAVTFWLNRRGTWRRKQTQPLGGRELSEGERVAITVKLNEEFGPEPDLKKLGLGVETDVMWHAGAIPSADGPVVPFSLLCAHGAQKADVQSAK